MAHVLIEERRRSIVVFRCECGAAFAFYVASQVDAFDDKMWDALHQLLKDHRARVGENGGLHVRKPMLHPVMCPHQ